MNWAQRLRNALRFRGGGRAQVPSLPVDDPLTSDQKRVYSAYTQVVDVFLQARRDGAAAKRIFKRLLKSHQREPRKIVMDKLRSYGVAHRALMPEQFTIQPSMPITGRSCLISQRETESGAIAGEQLHAGRAVDGRALTSCSPLVRKSAARQQQTATKKFLINRLWIYCGINCPGLGLPDRNIHD